MSSCLYCTLWRHAGVAVRGGGRSSGPHVATSLGTIRRRAMPLTSNAPEKKSGRSGRSGSSSSSSSSGDGGGSGSASPWGSMATDVVDAASPSDTSPGRGERKAKRHHSSSTTTNTAHSRSAGAEQPSRASSEGKKGTSDGLNVVDGSNTSTSTPTAIPTTTAPTDAPSPEEPKRGRGRPKQSVWTVDETREERFAAAITACIDGLRGSTAVVYSHHVGPALSVSLLRGGAAHVVKMGGGNETQAVQDAFGGGPTSGDGKAMGLYRFMPGDILDVVRKYKTGDMLGHVSPTPWDKDDSTGVNLVCVLPPQNWETGVRYPQKKGLVNDGHVSVMTLMYRMADREGIFRWGRVPSYMAVPVDLAKTMSAEDPGNPGFQRLSLLLGAIAHVTPLADLPPLNNIGRPSVMQLVRVVPRRVALADARWLDYCYRRVTIRKTSLGRAIKYVCPASDKLLEVAGLSPSLGTKTMTAEQHFALANALARFKHRPDISAIEGY